MTKLNGIRNELIVCVVEVVKCVFLTRLCCWSCWACCADCAEEGGGDEDKDASDGGVKSDEGNDSIDSSEMVIYGASVFGLYDRRLLTIIHRPHPLRSLTSMTPCTVSPTPK